MTYAVPPQTLTPGGTTRIALPQNADLLRAVVISNYSAMLCKVTISGLALWQNPWSAQLYSIPPSAGPITVAPQSVGIPLLIGGYYVAATFYNATEADEALMSGTWPVALTAGPTPPTGIGMAARSVIVAPGSTGNIPGVTGAVNTLYAYSGVDVGPWSGAGKALVEVLSTSGAIVSNVWAGQVSDAAPGAAHPTYGVTFTGAGSVTNVAIGGGTLTIQCMVYVSLVST